MSERVPTALRVLVQSRAESRCEYCLIHEDDAHFSHQPDHIIARKHRGPTEEANLAWACYLCNLLKGSDIASVDIESGQIVRLFNPRLDNWAEHFRLVGGRIVPLTAIGRVTEYLLQLAVLELAERLMETKAPSEPKRTEHHGHRVERSVAAKVAKRDDSQRASPSPAV
jgi:hypothetical protein